MKKLKNKKYTLFVIILVLIASITLTGCQTQSRQKAQPQNNSGPEAVIPQPQEQAPEDLKGFAEYTVRKQLGEKNNVGKDRIKSVNIKDGEVIIELNGNDVFSADMTVRGMLMDSKKILEPLSKRQDVKSVSVSEYLDVEDIGGGTVPEWVFTLSMDREGLDKVAGGDYLLNDLTRMAMEYKIHPNFMHE